MGISEVSSVSGSSYLGQGSSVKAVQSTPQTAPVEASQSSANSNYEISEKAAAAYKNNSEGQSSNNLDSEENGKKQATSSLREAVEKINATSANCEAVFGIHEATNRVTIKMVDKETHETVKEFPAEETLDLIAKAWELAGIMVDEKR